MTRNSPGAYDTMIDELAISDENKMLLHSLYSDGWKIEINDSVQDQHHLTVTFSKVAEDGTEHYIRLQPWEGPHGKLEGYKIDEWDTEMGEQSKRLVFYDLPEEIAFERAKYRLLSQIESG